jgi:hypothetical protein
MWKIFSIEGAKELLGYEPEDGAGQDYILGSPPGRT